MLYFGNIYLLNRAALRIQHWYFSKKQAKLTVTAPETPQSAKYEAQMYTYIFPLDEAAILEAIEANERSSGA